MLDGMDSKILADQATFLLAYQAIKDRRANKQNTVQQAETMPVSADHDPLADAE